MKYFQLVSEQVTQFIECDLVCLLTCFKIGMKERQSIGRPLLLKGHNYGYWKARMKAFLKALAIKLGILLRVDGRLRLRLIRMKMSLTFLKTSGQTIIRKNLWETPTLWMPYSLLLMRAYSRLLPTVKLQKMHGIFFLLLMKVLTRSDNNVSECSLPGSKILIWENMRPLLSLVL